MIKGNAKDGYLGCVTAQMPAIEEYDETVEWREANESTECNKFWLLKKILVSTCIL